MGVRSLQALCRVAGAVYSDSMDEARRDIEAAIEHLERGERAEADARFGAVVQAMLAAADGRARRAIAAMAVERLAAAGRPGLQVPFLQFLARQAPTLSEAARWVAAEGDVLAGQGDVTGATTLCCFARALVGDETLPVTELVLGTLGAAGLCRDAAAMGNDTLWQQLVATVRSSDALPAEDVGAVLTEIQTAMADGDTLSVETTVDSGRLTLHVGDRSWPRFVVVEGRLQWLGGRGPTN